MKPPCYECQDRTVGCHGKCEKYISWNKEHEKIRDAAHHEKQLKTISTEYRRDRYRRLTGKRN